MYGQSRLQWPFGVADVVGMEDILHKTDAQAELDRLQQRVNELETELGHRSWNSGDFYCLPKVSSAPRIVGQVVTLAGSGRPFEVIEAAEPDLMASVPTVRKLRDGLASNVIGCDKPDWWPL